MSHLDSFQFPSRPEARRFSGGAAALALSLALSLAGCGGGGRGEGASAESKALVSSDATTPDPSASGEPRASSQPPSFLPTSSQPPSAETIATQQEGGRLNSEELAQIAKTGVLSEAFPGKWLSGAEDAKIFSGTAKSAASRVPTYRFFNTRTSAHFFTTSEAERANVQATLPFMSFEGPAFNTSSTPVPGLSPVHRFYNTATGVHFYTISEAERAQVTATLPQFNYEGVAYHASTLPGTGYTPLYRFFYASKGFHFYTNSAAEKDNIIATLPQYSYEGVGYYVLGSDWQTPAVPHTGITAAQCYKGGSSVLATCTPTIQQILAGNTSLDLNPQQDGHRRGVNPMSYSAVGSNPITSCVRDEVTGLVWEGKEGSGPRLGTIGYTHLQNNAATDASGYVNAVNALNLCGFNDWRLPTLEELQGLVNYGLISPPLITSSWFPNTKIAPYWTSTNYADSTLPAVWAVDFETGKSDFYNRTAFLYPVRLVHGAPWSGPRYLITSEPYAGDAANNAVIDRKTGLTWRRCLEESSWTGSQCEGGGFGFTHEGALNRARTQVGWRLPNIKELGTLADRSRIGPALDISAFGLPPSIDSMWSSTPQLVGVSLAMYARLVDGLVVVDGDRVVSRNPRLVRITP